MSVSLDTRLIRAAHVTVGRFFILQERVYPAIPNPWVGRDRWARC
jgi:hypothetical protein